MYETDDESKIDAWNRALKAGALGQPRGMGWGERLEGGSGPGDTCTPLLIYGKTPHTCPHGSVGKGSACNGGDPGSIPGSGRSAGEGIGYPLQYSWSSTVAQLVKNLPAMQETWVWPGLVRFPGKWKDYPLQYSGLENSMDCIVHGVTESDMTEWLSLHFISWQKSPQYYKVISLQINILVFKNGINLIFTWKHSEIMCNT